MGEGLPVTPSLGSFNVPKWFSNIKGKSYVYPVITKIILKEPDEQPEEEIHRVRLERVLSSGASDPRNWGTPPSQHIDVFLIANMEASWALSF